MNAIKCQFCAALANMLIARDAPKKVVPQCVCASCAKQKRRLGYEVVARLKEQIALAA